MPPPTGVVSGPLMETRNSLQRLERLLGQPLAVLRVRLLAGEDLHPGDLPLAAVRLLDRGVEHAHRRAPDVGAGAVALDEGDDGIVGDVERALLERDRLALGRGGTRSGSWPCRSCVSVKGARSRRKATRHDESHASEANWAGKLAGSRGLPALAYAEASRVRTPEPRRRQPRDCVWEERLPRAAFEVARLPNPLMGPP